MNTLILNLTRFGDLLQTQPVAHALHQQGHTVGIVCLSNFAPAAALLEGVDHVLALPGSTLLAELDTGWAQALTSLHHWAEATRQTFAPDQVINLTSTPPARLLARRLAGSAPVHGFSVDDHGFGLTGSAWTAFFEASTRKRGCSPYNIVDVFVRAAGLPMPAHVALRAQPTEQARAAAQQLADCTPPSCLGHVAFQLGASEARRQWPAASFAAVGARLWHERRVLPVLLGTADERPLIDRYVAAGGPGIDLVGRTSLTELSAVLEHMQLLLTNDTGTMHLAAGLGIPSLAIFLATAQPWDTGPYLENCCSLEPALPCHPCAFGAACPQELRCTGHIDPDAVWPLLASYLDDRQWICPPATADAARVWQTVRDDQGYLDLCSLSGHEAEDRTVWIRMQRHFYRQFLDRLDSPQDFDASAPFVPLAPHLTATLSALLRQRHRDYLQQVDALLHLFGEQGRLTLLRPAAQHGQRFLATCHRIGAMFDGYDAFNALGRLWQTSSQERGEALPELLEFADLLRRMLATWKTNLE